MQSMQTECFTLITETDTELSRNDLSRAFTQRPAFECHEAACQSSHPFRVTCYFRYLGPQTIQPLTKIPKYLHQKTKLLLTND